VKRAVFYSHTLLLLLTGFLSGIWIVGIAFDYEVTLHMPQVYTWTTAACALAAVWMMRIASEKGGDTEMNASPLCLPFALLYSLSLLWLARWEKVIVPVFICLLCTMYLFRRYVKRSGLRLACKLLSFVIIPVYLLLLPGFILLSDFGKTTVVKTLESPDGRYQAILVDVDQGALGGNTDVYVEDGRKSFHTGVISYQKKKLVYRTGWGAFENMELVWDDHETLRIDGKPYHADGF